MSVIGRLDDQVDAVIIAPVARRRAGEGAAAGRDERDSLPEEAGAGEAAPVSPSGSDRHETAGSPPERATLPVWLL